MSTPPSTPENSPAPLSAEQSQSLSGEKCRSGFTGGEGERESDGLETDSVLAIAGCVLSAVLAPALGEIYVYSHEADEEIEGLLDQFTCY